MKYIGKLPVLAAAILAAAMVAYSYAGNHDRDNKGSADSHVLVRQWKDYAKADKADMPDRKERILDEIIKEAGSRGYVSDFYDGCSKWYWTVLSRDWKRGEDAGRRVADAAARFGNPIVFYRLAKDRIIDANLGMEWFDSEIAAGCSALLRSRNPLFYSQDLAGILPDFILDKISNDYEYLLWSLSVSGHRYYPPVPDEVRKRAESCLSDYLGGAYPSGAYMEFRTLLDSISSVGSFHEKEIALKAFEKKYEGKAIALLASQESLSDRKNNLDMRLYRDDVKPASDDCRSLRSDCAEFEQARKAFGGKEMAIAEYCKDAKAIIESLDSKSIILDMSDVPAVLLRNMEEVEVKVHDGTADGKVVHRAVLKDTLRSYYVWDTVRFVFPETLDDGDYFIECSGKGAESEYRFSKKTISAAYRVNADGAGIYAADYKTGRPVEKVDMELLSKGKVVRTFKDFRMEGFTSVQGIIDELRKDYSGAVGIRCSFTGGDGVFRKSGDMYLSGRSDVSRQERNTSSCIILKDRSAFHPGDTVRFKAILYSVSGDVYSVLPEGSKADAVLYDAAGNKVSRLELETDDFGSVAGEFRIPADTKGGNFRIAVEGDDAGSQSWLTVDEFVLPTYDLEFEKDTSLYYNGDTIVVRGRLSSYSGHKVSAARLSCSVRSSIHNETILSREIEPLGGGEFEFSFPACGGRDAGSTYSDIMYYVTVKASDRTGETLEWNASYRSEPSVRIDIRLAGRADAKIYALDKAHLAGRVAASAVLDGEIARFDTDVYANSSSGNITLPVEIRYKVLMGGKPVSEGTVMAGEKIIADLSGKPSGIYELDAEAVYARPDGKLEELDQSCVFLKTSSGDTAIYSDIDFFSKKYDNGSIAVQVGSTSGPEWIVAELYDGKARLLRSGIVCLDGIKGQDGSVRMIEMEYKDDYPDNVRLQLFSFKDGKSRTASYDFSRKNPEYRDLPLEFSSFTDKSLPRGECVFGVKTLPDAECAVSVFDVSTEKIAGNLWIPVYRHAESVASVPVVPLCGNAGIRAVTRYSVTKNGGLPEFGLMNKEVTEEDFGALDAVPFAAGAVDAGSSSDVQIRDRFGSTLAFLPSLRSDDEGDISFRVNANDMLSTYCIQVFAHNRGMDSAVIRREMIVTRPVKVSVAQPQFLYGGDVYRLKASVSNGSDSGISGRLMLYLYDTAEYSGAEPVAVKSMDLSIAAGESSAGEFDLDVPQYSGGGVLGLKVIYKAEEGDHTVSDGLFVTVPVKVPVQTLTEAHSAVLRPGMDRDSLRCALSAMFTDTPGQTYCCREVSLLDMLLESVPGKVEPEPHDILSLTEAYYTGVMAAAIRRDFLSGPAPLCVGDAAGQPRIPDSLTVTLDKIAGEILGCQNADGGFAWFEGFRSSPVLTAVVAERFAMLRGMLSEYSAAETGAAADEAMLKAMGGAVKYLDSVMLIKNVPLWSGGISLGQYLYVRSMYPEIAYAPDADKKTLAEFRKSVKSYLLPSRNDALASYILEKARRAAAAQNLSGSDSLEPLHGISRSRLAKAVDADMASLIEYSVPHYSGGTYYPNAVMPFRGLLESEVYAHSLLCGLMSRYSEVCRDSSRKGADVLAAKADAVAEGIRLWLMLQKETQKWDGDPAYINAVNSVLEGSEKLRNTSVMILTKRYMKPFAEVSAAGNGFTVVRTFYRERTVNENGSGNLRMAEIMEGDTLCIGDRIVAEYKVWSAENRSFVRLSSPRYAALRPVLQLSGNVGGWARPVSQDSGGFSFVPYAYREVKSDRTDWYMDVCPEEYSTFAEEFYVTQSGKFIAPAITIESLYSPHYRANGMFSGFMTVE